MHAEKLGTTGAGDKTCGKHWWHIKFDVDMFMWQKFLDFDPITWVHAEEVFQEFMRRFGSLDKTMQTLYLVTWLKWKSVDTMQRMNYSTIRGTGYR